MIRKTKNRPAETGSKKPPVAVDDKPLVASPPLAGLDIDGENKSALRRMVNEKEIRKLFGTSHANLYRMVKRGKFPKPTFMSPNRCFWFEDQVLAWQNGIEGQGRGAASLKQSEVDEGQNQPTSENSLKPSA